MAYDYETYALSRLDIRFFSTIVRLKLNIKGKVPVVELLDILEEKYGVTYVIEQDELFDKKVMAYLDMLSGGEFCIHIRESVYNAACEGNYAARGFIFHEMCHYFLINWFGYGPLFNRAIGNRKVIRFKSMEWQAKALCGEIMIPYDVFTESSIKEIMECTGSSYTQARYYVEVVLKRNRTKDTEI